MFNGKDKAVPTSNDWWPPHTSVGDFVNYPTQTNRIRDHLTRASAAKYYPNGLPKDFKECPETLTAEGQGEAAKANSAGAIVERITKTKDLHGSRNLSALKRREPDSLVEARSEPTPATPRPQNCLPVPVPTRRRPLILLPETRETPPDTPMYEPGKPPVVQKPALAGLKNGSPLRKSWVVADFGDSSGEDGWAQQC